jgi:hypothetical protein
MNRLSIRFAASHPACCLGRASGERWVGVQMVAEVPTFDPAGPTPLS